jgi:hypothetical protein
MLIQITQRCLEGCSHCFIDAAPDRQDMTEEVFEGVLNFLTPARGILVSGGEPTLHPHFFEWVSRIVGLKKKVFLLSNGSFVDDTKKLNEVKELQKKGVLIEIRTHPLYYPNYHKTKAKESLFTKLGFFFAEDGLDSLVKLGRAKPENGCFLGCTNLVLGSRQLNSFEQVIEAMESRGKLCTPLVAIDGKVHCGETQFCESIGTVFDSKETLFSNLKKFNPLHCDRCYGSHVLHSKYPQAIRILNE